MRDSSMFYRSQCDAIRALPPDQFKKVVCALWDYELDGIVPEGDPIVTAMYLMAKPLMDRRNAHYENGKKGGRPKTQKPSDNQNKPSDNLSEPDKTVKDKGERIKDKYNYKDIVDYLNQKAGTAYRASSQKTQSLIRARFSDGFTLDDFKKVIDSRCAAWKGDSKMQEYLRPETLFGTKFESYLNAKPGQRSSNKFINFQSRTYDYDDLERKLTGVGI